MKSIREYSDLSDIQKIVYIKRGIVICISNIIPLMILTGVFLSVVNSYQQEQEESTIPVSNATTLEQDNESLDEDDIRLISLLFLFLGALYGIGSIGSQLGWYFADKLNLYTDFNLDEVEKHYHKVKNAVENQKGSQSHDSVKSES